MHAFGIALCINDHTALRLGRGDLVEAVPQAFVEGMIEPLEAIGIAGALGGPGKPFRNRHIEDEGQIGCEIAEHKMVQRLQFRDRQAAPIPLVGERRIGKAVAHDPYSALDCEEAPGRRRPRFAQCNRLQIRGAAAIATRPSAPMRSTSAPATSVASAGGISGTVTTTLPTGWPFLSGAGTGLS